MPICQRWFITNLLNLWNPRNDNYTNSLPRLQTCSSVMMMSSSTSGQPNFREAITGAQSNQITCRIIQFIKTLPHILSLSKSANVLQSEKKFVCLLVFSQTDFSFFPVEFTLAFSEIIVDFLSIYYLAVITNMNSENIY